MEEKEETPWGGGGGRYQCSHGYGPAARRPSLMVREGRPVELGAVCMCPVAKMPSSPPRGEPVSRTTSSEGRAGCGGWLAFQLRRCSGSEVPIAEPHTRCLRTEADSCPVLYPEISAPGPSGPSQQRRKIPGGRVIPSSGASPESYSHLCGRGRRPLTSAPWEACLTQSRAVWAAVLRPQPTWGPS